MKKNWQILPTAPKEFFEVNVNYSTIVNQLLYNRGLVTNETIEYFLQPELQASMLDPFLFRDMEAAINLTISHIKAGNKIVICGDYDADGVTSSALLAETLRTLKAQIEVWIPSRFGEGYGLNKNIINELYQNQVKLIITVDNGVRAKEEVILAQSLGMEVIVTDHHEGPVDDNELPPCLLINPILKKETYPFKYLCGVGVAYKFASALIGRSTLAETDKVSLIDSLVDLAAIGTISDCVTLFGENRLLVARGLKLINKKPRRGLKELLEVALVNADELNSWNISWQITPRLNAAGRIDHANTAYKLFTVTTTEEATQLAQELNEKNIERQKITTEIMEQGIAIVEKTQMSEKLLIVISPDLEDKNKVEERSSVWPEGIIGLVAGRICERFSKPCFVICQSEGKIKGSGRSIEKFDLGGSLEFGKDYLERYGGHKMACGFTVKSIRDLKLFSDKMREIANQKLSDEDLIGTLNIDKEISLDDITEQLIEEIDTLKPYGQDNPEPKFVSYKVMVEDVMLMGQEKKHIKFRVGGMWALGFNKAEVWKDISVGLNIDLVYTLGVNIFNNRRDLQLKVVDLRVSQ